MLHDEYNIMNIPGFFSPDLCLLANAFIFNVFELQHFDFCEALKQQETIIRLLRQLKAPYYFLRNEAIFATTMLITSNTISENVGETILLVCVIHEELIVLELLRKSDGYMIVERRDVDCEDETDYRKLKKEILGNRHPFKIIVSPVLVTSNKKLMDIVKNQILKSMEITVLEYNFEKDTSAFLGAIIMYLDDKSSNMFHILPRCHSGYAVSLYPSPTNMEVALFVVNKNDALPLEKSCLLPRTTKSTVYLSYLHNERKKYEKVKTFELMPSKKIDHHKIKVTLIIDENNIPFLYQDKVVLPEIEAMPSKLNKMKHLDFPVIAFFDNSAVICVKKENGYTFLESWNGVCGNDLFLHFNQEKPTLLAKVKDSVKHTVIKASDIIKVMTMPCDNITIDPKWSFTVVSDDENPVLLEFDDVDGEKSAASPAFLMALIVKELVRIIKMEIGEMPTKLGIYIFNEFDQKAKKKRVEAQLQEACSLLKLDSQIL
uniref:Uncharacterized protein n=1 Tax=Panagrolaimus sp. ES5 TaxID=591445 RepID=A0AC34H0C1_9BILA